MHLTPNIDRCCVYEHCTTTRQDNMRRNKLHKEFRIPQASKETYLESSISCGIGNRQMKRKLKIGKLKW